MFPCIRCTKPTVDERDEEGEGRESSTPRTKEAAKSFTTQIKGIAVRISGSCKQCKGSTRSSSRQKGHTDHSGAASEGVGGATSSSTPAACDITASSTRLDSSASASNVEQNESQDQWIAEVEEGIHITFVSLPTGGNVLKRIHFSREKFDRNLAQRWWIENYERIKELYNVQRFNLSTPGRSEDEQGEGSHSRLKLSLEGSMDSNRDWTHYDPFGNRGNQPYDSEPLDEAVGHYIHAGSSSSSSSSSLSMKTLDSSRDALSLSNTICSELEAEWVEQDEPGVFITIRQLADGTRELRRLRFSRKHFEAEDAKKWWLENKDRVQAKYL